MGACVGNQISKNKNIPRAGFSLIELMIYLVLLCMLSLFVSRFCVQWYHTFFNGLLLARHCQQETTALALMQRDIETAPAQATQWYVIEPNVLIVNRDDYTLSWLLQDGILYRAVGNYNVITHTWKTRKKQQVATHIASFNIQVYKDLPTDSVKYVTIQLIGDHGKLSLERTISLYNRELL